MASEFLQIAEKVLSNLAKPMTAREIVDHAKENGLFSDRVAGKTPFQTMKAKLSVDIRTHGPRSVFVRTAPGRFFLRAGLSHELQPYEARPYVKPPPSERVLTIPLQIFREQVDFQGISKNYARITKQLLRPEVCKHIDRLTAEVTNDSKQVLTYILVTRGTQLLCFQRGNFNRVEDFLRGSSCVGFGGHVAEQDHSLLSMDDMGLRDSARRELAEEICLPDVDKRRIINGDGLAQIGVLNDDSSAVGRRHAAFLFRYEVSDDPAWDKPLKGEKSIAQLHWIVPGDGIHPIWRFEYWSQLCLRQFFPELASTAPAFRLQRQVKLQKASVICVIGSLGSGKTEAVKALQESFHFSEINSGRVLAKLLGIRPVNHKTRKTFQEKALTFIQRVDGPKRLAAAIAKEIRRSKALHVVVDGIRQRATYDELCKLMGRQKVAVIYVYTLPDTAFILYKKRTNNQALEFDEFLSLREAEVEQGVPEFLKIADAVVYNWIGLSAYLRALKRMFKKAKVGI